MTLGDLEALSLAKGLGRLGTAIRIGVGDSVVVEIKFLGCSVAASWGELPGLISGFCSSSEARVESQADALSKSSNSSKRKEFMVKVGIAQFLALFPGYLLL